MPKKYRISVGRDDELRILVVRPMGAMPGALFVDRLVDVYRRLDQPWLYRRLIDLRHYGAFIGFEEFEHLARRWAVITRDADYSGGRLAIVSHDPLDLARLSTLAPLFPNDVVRGFLSQGRALEWFDEP